LSLVRVTLAQQALDVIGSVIRLACFCDGSSAPLECQDFGTAHQRMPPTTILDRRLAVPAWEIAWRETPAIAPPQPEEIQSGAIWALHKIC